MLMLFLMALWVDGREGVMSLQLPGLSFGTGEPTTVEIEFLDSSDSTLFLLKGEVFSQTLPMRADNSFFPDSLTGAQKYVSKLRIKAGESGMTLKLFDGPTSAVPKLMVLMKTGFIMGSAGPIEIDFTGGDDHQTTSEAEINWYNRDTNEMTQMKGMHIGKIELHVERYISAPLVPVKAFGAISVENNSPAQVMNSAAGSPSLINSNNVAVLPAPVSSPQNFQMAMMNPIGSQLPS